MTAGQPGTALTWTYGYAGDLLSSVCPPGTTTACTSYGYITNGSHAPTAVRNTNPDAYYRLDDPSGTGAAYNQMPVDELTTLDPPAAEISTTPGVAGPISGVTATGFNGTSSWIPLDGAWCGGPSTQTCEQTSDTGRVLSGNGKSNGNTTLNNLAISVWFKTSSPSGVLAGVSGVFPGATACLQVTNPCQCSCGRPTRRPAAVDRLSNGRPQRPRAPSARPADRVIHVRDAATALTSPAVVDNGAWHQAVVVPGQALYLDGKLVVSGSGKTLTLPAPANTDLGDLALLGAGPPLRRQQPGAAWLQLLQRIDGGRRGLAEPGTGPGRDIGAQYAAETHSAAELTTITSPSGRADLSAVMATRSTTGSPR